MTDAELRLQIQILRGDIADQAVDAVVNAANNHLWMGSGVAGAIKRRGGQVIEDEALRLGPIEIGTAVATGAGALKARFVIHAAAMGQDLRTSPELVSRATRSALEVAERLGIRCVAFPAVGAGVGGLDLERCAEVMFQAVFEFRAESLKEVRFVLFDRAAEQAFETVWRKLGSGRSSR